MDEKTLSGLEKLNQLCLTDEEQSRVLSFFSERETGENDLKSFDTSEVMRMVHVMPLENVLRSDVSMQPFSREELLAGAPEQSDGYWQVPRLVE